MIVKPEWCRSCSLAGNMRGYSALEGDGSSGLMVIAESLGRNEERDGLPLRPDGKSGEVFQQAVDMSGLSRSLFTITNTIRCRAEAPYSREALDHCRRYLDEAVAERKPRFILALGDVPLQELSTQAGSISELRGFVLQSIYGTPMLATYHPSYLARGAYGTLYGVFMHDLRRAHQMVLRGVPEPLPTSYILQPTKNDVESYLTRLRTDPDLPVAYDIETASILGEAEPADWREKRIIQIQFSSGAGEALVLPWEGEWIDAACSILTTDNMKWGWNDRLSDRLALRRYVSIRGEQHDLMNAWSHLQPNFMSNKDEKEGADKGVPARLMSLQSCVSFYYPWEGCWKGTVQKVIDAEYEDEGVHDAEIRASLEYYGARDCDLTFRVGQRIFSSLKRMGLW